LNQDIKHKYLQATNNGVRGREKVAKVCVHAMFFRIIGTEKGFKYVWEL